MPVLLCTAMTIASVFGLSEREGVNMPNTSMVVTVLSTLLSGILSGLVSVQATDALGEMPLVPHGNFLEAPSIYGKPTRDN